MICIARTFGAPDTVPAGKHARKRSNGGRPGEELARDLGHEVRHVRVALGLEEPPTRTVPGLHTRERSLRPRSTSMMCSARSFSEARSPSASPRRAAWSRRSGSGSPASPSFTRVSGRSRRARCRRARGGRGTARVHAAERPVEGEGSDVRGRSARWATTIWNASPSRMYSFARRTLLVGVALRGEGLLSPCVAAPGFGSLRSAESRAATASRSPGSTSAVAAWSKRTRVSATTKRLSGSRCRPGGAGRSARAPRCGRRPR